MFLPLYWEVYLLIVVFRCWQSDWDCILGWWRKNNPSALHPCYNFFLSLQSSHDQYFFLFLCSIFFSFLTFFPLHLFISSFSNAKSFTFYWVFTLLILLNSYYAFEIWEFPIFDDEDTLLKSLSSSQKITQSLSDRIIQRQNQNHISTHVKEHKSGLLSYEVDQMVISVSVGSRSFYMPSGYSLFFCLFE